MPDFMINEDLQNLIPFYKELDKPELDLILQTGRFLTFEKNEIISGGKTSCQGFISVKSGEISAGMISEDGREAELFTLSAGDFCIFSASCLFLPKTFHVQMTAAKESKVFIIPSATVEKLRSMNIHVELFAYKIMTKRFSYVMAATEELLFVSVEKRLLKILLSQADDKEGLPFSVFITQETLAKKLGTAREVVSRILSAFRKKGIIETKRGQIIVKDPGRLKNLLENQDQSD